MWGAVSLYGAKVSDIIWLKSPSRKTTFCDFVEERSIALNALFLSVLNFAGTKSFVQAFV